MIYLLPILQAKLRFSGNLLGNKQKTDPKTTLITLGAIILFFILAVLFNKLFGGSSALRQHRGVFKRKARELHLSKIQIKLLLTLLKEADVKKPLMVLSHPANLNSLLRRAIRNIKKESISTHAKQSKITSIYRVKHHLDKYQKSSQVKNTHELKVGNKVVIERNDKKSYTSSITGNYENFFCIKLPTDSIGNQIKWKKGSGVKIVAFDRNNKESHFMSKTLGIKNVGATNTIIIAHTLRTTQKVARGLQRVDVSLTANVFPVDKIYDKSRKQHIFKANRSAGRIGKLLDISSGGCALTMKLPYPEGHLIELDFELEDDITVKLQAKILKLRISRGRKITHVKFTRASARHLNLINNFIYSLG